MLKLDIIIIYISLIWLQTNGEWQDGSKNFYIHNPKSLNNVKCYLHLVIYQVKVLFCLLRSQSATLSVIMSKRDFICYQVKVLLYLLPSQSAILSVVYDVKWNLLLLPNQNAVCDQVKLLLCLLWSQSATLSVIKSECYFIQVKALNEIEIVTISVFTYN